MLFSMNKKERSVLSTEKKTKKDFRVLEVKFEKVMKDNQKFEKANETLKTENETLTSDFTIKKAEMDLKKEAIKMDLAKITLDRQVLTNEAKIRANKQKADLALEHLHAKMASVQAKETLTPPTRRKQLRKNVVTLKKGSIVQLILDLTWQVSYFLEKILMNNL